MNAYFGCFYLYFEGKNPQKGAYPLTYQIQWLHNYYINVWSMEINYYEMQS